MQVNWSGVYPATTTQFGLDQSLDIPATVQHAVNLVDAGVDGLVMLGTVGENCSLEMAEKLDVLRATMTAVQGRMNLIWWPLKNPLTILVVLPILSISVEIDTSCSVGLMT